MYNNIGITAIHTPSHRGSGVSVYPTPGGIRAEKGHNISTGMAAGCSHSREWNLELRDHPDPVLRHYILNGIWNGFRIGFDRGVPCTPASSNMRSALDNASVVQEYLDKEVTLGRIVGPVSPEMVPVGTQLSPFGVIPKSNQPGKWRLIVDLSSPGGRSGNDGIQAEICSLSYLHLDVVIDHIVAEGRKWISQVHIAWYQYTRGTDRFWRSGGQEKLLRHKAPFISEAWGDVGGTLP